MKWSQFKDLLPLLGVIVGYFGSLLTEEVRDRHSRDRERRRWEADLQRDTLLELQTAIADLTRYAQATVYEKGLAREQSGIWPDFTPVQHTFDEEVAVRLRVLALVNRVMNAEVRKQIDAFAGYEVLAVSGPEAVAQGAQAKMIAEYVSLNELLGMELRSLFVTSPGVVAPRL